MHSHKPVMYGTRKYLCCVCTNGSNFKQKEEFHLILHFFVVMQLLATSGSTVHTAADKVNKEEQHSFNICESE